MPQQPVAAISRGENLLSYLEKLRRVANLGAHLESGDDFILIDETPEGRILRLDLQGLLLDLGVPIIKAFIVSSSSQDSTNNRYKYTCNLGRLSDTGHGNWEVNTEDKDNNGVQSTYDLYSINEDANTSGAGEIYGNGVPEDDLSAAAGTWVLKVIPADTPVYAKLEKISFQVGNQTVIKQQWVIINLPNGVSGTC